MLTYEEKVTLYKKLIAAVPEIEPKGKTIPYCSINGHMFSQLSKEEEVGIRLPKEERERFLEKYGTKLLVSYGATMKEYVTVPENLLTETDTLKTYLKISYNYTKSLKLKPTKK